MMRISFEDKSYIEFSEDLSGRDKIFITIAAKNPNNSQSLLVSSVLVEKEKLKTILEKLIK